MKKCLIADSMHESLFSMLEKIGWQWDYKPDISREEIMKIHVGYDGLIIRSKTTIDRSLLGENPTLKFVGRAGAGIDNLDEEYLREKKIEILHAAEGNRDAVGEISLGLLLSLMRKIPKADSEVRNLVWDREGNRGEEVMGKTIGLIGYGNMGQAFSQRLSGFSCKVIAYDKYKKGFANPFCAEVAMDRIFDEADILSLHIPLTGETKGLVDINYFSSFRKSIILLNTSRGEIVPLDDLTKAMEAGKVRGAALDVLENEKLNKLTESQKRNFERLKRKNNVIFTPHIAGWTYESHVKINIALVDKIKSLPVS